jgi:hypothetical protein
MMTQIHAVQQRNEELRKQSDRDTILQETVPGEDKILTEEEKRIAREKIAKSTSDEDTN